MDVEEFMRLVRYHGLRGVKKPRCIASIFTVELEGQFSAAELIWIAEHLRELKE